MLKPLRLILLIGLIPLISHCATSEPTTSTSTGADGDSDAESSVSITVSGSTRTIVSNAIPDHGIDTETDYPNTLQEKTLTFTMTTEPEKNESTTSYAEPHKFGVATNGIPLDPFTAEYYNNDRSSGWHIDATGGNLGLDKYGAHIQPDGTYHYHSVKDDFFTAFGISSLEHSPIVGYAADGFPIYAKYVYSIADDADSEIIELRSNYRLKTGTRPDGPGGTYDGTFIEDYEFVDSLNSDLNDANARFGITPDFPSGTWYYVLTNDFPYIPIKFLGDTDSSFEGGPSGKLFNFLHQSHSHPH